MFLLFTDEDSRYEFDGVLPFKILDILRMASHQNGPFHLRCLDADHIEADRSGSLPNICWHNKWNTCTQQ